MSGYASQATNLQSPKGNEGNPLKFDEELRDLVGAVENIKTYRKFKGWKGSFLSRFETFLAEDGIAKAEGAHQDFQSGMGTIMKYVHKCDSAISEGNLSNEKTTVKGRNSLNELSKQLRICCDETEALIPSTNKEEKKRGYNKFHLGAVLVRDGFTQFDRMQELNQKCAAMSQSLSEVADPQQIALMEEYGKQFQKFCDVMADLGLYKIMLACRQFAEEPEEEEPPEPINITIESYDGKILRLELDPTETIGNIKDAIAPGCEIPADQQVLKFRGKELNDNGKSLEDLNIEDGAVLKVAPFQIPITVNTMDGKKLKVMVDPTNELSKIKKQLENDSGIPADNQRLYFNGNELDDDKKTVADYGITAGDELDLEPKKIKVQVDMPDGSTKTVEISPNDDTNAIKAKIEDQTGMEAPKQVLKMNGKELPDDGTPAKKMGIREGSKIKVEVYKVPVTVNTMDGKKIQVMVDPTDTLGAIKKDLENESGIPPDNQRLFMKGQELPDDNKTAGDYGIKGGSVLDLEPKKIKVTVDMPDGKKIEVDIEPSDTDDGIKKKIEAKSGMPAPTQVVKFNGKELPKGSTVKDIGIRDGDNLKVDTFKVPVTVNTMDGKKIQVMVDPTDKLGDVKKQLEDESGIPPENQRLFMNGQELADDNKTAGDHGIKGGSVLDLEPKKIKVTVDMPDGKQIEVDIEPKDTSDGIKKKIEAKSGMPAPKQVVKFNGKELPNDGSTVKDMGIRDGDNLKVDIFKVPVTVNTMDGKKIKVMVDPTDKLGDIKKQLEDESGLAPDNQRLFKDGQELPDDDKTANDYGIKAGTVLDLEPKSMTVGVDMPDGSKVEVDISPSDNADKIKKKIAIKTGLEVPRQVLKFNGKELPKDGTTVKDLGIRPGDNLKVDIYKVPVKVNTYDGKTIKIMVDPTEKLIDVKKQLEDESGLPASNQKLTLENKELVDDNKTAGAHGIVGGSILDLEPKKIKVSVDTPDGKTIEIEVAPSDTTNNIKSKIADKTGVSVPRQVLKMGNKKLPADGTVKNMGIREGSKIKCDIFTIPITVKTQDGKTLNFDVEPIDSVDKLKKEIEKKTGLEPKKQVLKFGEEELKQGRKTMDECGIKANSELSVEPLRDSIIFVDIKSGVLFGMDRDLVIEKGILTPNQGNKLDFMEAATDSAARDKIRDVMMKSPKLGVNPQVVVEGNEVEDYDLAEAEKVKSKWGVSLKKREKNKKGEEFLYIDPKSGASGELSRQKYIDSKFITPKATKNGETLEEAEKDTMIHEKYITDIRNVFNVRSAT